ncbi:MAG TPA: trehalose-6-phosphate synthase, partial [Phycisphaerae bacterium]|nr:trehalose-6-phosphate synthase [Phycisphaerae bacterium]
EVRARSRRLRMRLAPRNQIMLGVDRLDYTKGIDIRLRAYHEMLQAGTITADRCALVQVAVPTREYVPEYQELRSRIERIVGEIDGEFGELGCMPVQYLHRNQPTEEIVALYLAADVMLVTPLRDGMNLVAKEYVACRRDDTGALVLSEFAGAAHELRDALIVNPHDIDAVKRTIETALKMPLDQQKRRMKAMRRVIKKNDVFHWAGSFLKALQHANVGTKA